MPRTCVFCGGKGVTNEHILAQRFRRYFPAGDRPGQHDRETEDGFLSQWDGPMLNATVKRVCGECNGGWMRQADAALDPLIGRMMHGHAVELTPERQKLLASWATRVALLYRFRRKPPSPPSPERLQWLFRHREPPPETDVWLAVYELPNATRYQSGLLSVIRSEDGMHVDGELATILVGHLVLQVLDLPNRGNITLHVPPADQRFDVQIWPPSPLILLWPPPLALNKEGLDYFGKRFINEQDWLKSKDE